MGGACCSQGNNVSNPGADNEYQNPKTSNEPYVTDTDNEKQSIIIQKVEGGPTSRGYLYLDGQPLSSLTPEDLERVKNGLIQHAANIKWISMQYCSLDDECLIALLPAMCQCVHLQELCLGNNDLGDRSGNELVRVAAAWPALMSLLFANNPKMSQGGIEKLKQLASGLPPSGKVYEAENARWGSQGPDVANFERYNPNSSSSKYTQQHQQPPAKLTPVKFSDLHTDIEFAAYNSYVGTPSKTKRSPASKRVTISPKTSNRVIRAWSSNEYDRSVRTILSTGTVYPVALAS